MALTWEQFRKAPISSLPRSAVVLPVAVSVLVHLGIVATVVFFQIGPKAREGRLTEAPTETVLTLAPEPAPELPQPPAPPPPPPEPEPAGAPEPTPTPTPEPEPEPATPVSTDVLPDPVPVKATEPTPTPQNTAPAPPALPAAKAPIVVSKPVETTPAPVTFAGVEGTRARRVVYVVDASGAMTSSLKLVLEELSRSIGRLDASQSFQVVVMRESQEDPSTRATLFSYNGESGLTAATTDAKVRASTWLASLTPSGRSDPLAGLTAALKLRPDLVFLLTKSIRRTGSNTDWGAGNKATLQKLDELNPVDFNTGQRATVIKAIQFIDEDPTGLLRAIGATHGDGPDSYKLLTLEDLKRRGSP